MTGDLDAGDQVTVPSRADGRDTAFLERYGPWAVVAGASEGLGGEFARQIAARGLNVVLIARRSGLLEERADELRGAYGVETLPLALDLADRELADRVAEAIGDRRVGLLVYNAGLSVIGEFLDAPLERHLTIVDVNCRGPIALSHRLGLSMRERGRGGIVLMSSMAGFQGSALVSSYAATKAFNRVLGESLWEELRQHGVDVLVTNAGATRTPNYLATEPRRGRFGAPEMEAKEVVAQTLKALGRRGRPNLVPGVGNKLASLFMQRLMPRSWAVRIMGRAMRKLYGGRDGDERWTES